MKLLLATPSTLPTPGGLERYVWRSALGLVDRHDWDVRLVQLGPLQADPHPRMRQTRFPTTARVASTPVGFWSSAFDRLMRAERPDVVLAHTPVPLFADVAARRAAAHRIPFVLTYHCDLTTGGVFTPLRIAYDHLILPGTLQKARCIVVTSMAYAESSPRLHRHLERAVAMPPGVDLPPDTPVPMATRPNHALFVARLHPYARWKGLDRLLAAMPEILERIPDARLRVIGDGADLPRYRAIVSRLGIDSAVDFLCLIDEASLATAYAHARVVVLPSITRAENFGMVLLEAQAHGTPVVASAIGGIPSAMVDGQTGVLVPPGDVSALARAVASLMEDIPRCDAMGQAARKFAAAFTWEETTRRLDATLREVTS